MGKSLLKEVSREELLTMRESGMTNRDIANSLDVSIATIYRHIGAQPPGLRRRYEYESPALPDNQTQREEFDEAALVVEDRRLSLAGLFAGYKVNIKAKEVVVFVEDGVDALVVPFDQVENFANELRALSKHVKDLRVGNEVW